MGLLRDVMVVSVGVLVSRLGLRGEDAENGDGSSPAEEPAAPTTRVGGRFARVDARRGRDERPAPSAGAPDSLPITPAFEPPRDAYVIRLPHKPEADERPRRAPGRRALPLVALAVLVAIAGALAYFATADDDTGREARPTTTAEVLGASTTRRATPPARRATRAVAPAAALGTLRTMRPPGRSLFPVPGPAALSELDGSYVRARNVRVQSLVGDEAFWIGEGGSNRILVHLSSAGESRAWVRAGSRVSFVGAIAPNKPGAAIEYGLIPGEGPELLERQGRHIEVLASKLSVR